MNLPDRFSIKIALHAKCKTRFVYPRSLEPYKDVLPGLVNHPPDDVKIDGVGFVEIYNKKHQRRHICLLTYMPARAVAYWQQLSR